MFLANYLTLETTEGLCIELVNGCRTQAYMQLPPGDGPHPHWSTGDDGQSCTICCCETFREPFSHPALDPAPWYDPLIPASEEFFGLALDYGGLRLVPQEVTSRWQRRRWTLILTGHLITSSAAGTRFGRNWINRVLLELLDSCDGWTATVADHCPTDPDGGSPFEPPILVAPGFDDPCDPVQELLGPAEPVMPRTDDGIRRILNVSLPSPTSIFDPGDDPDIDICEGERIQIELEVDSEYRFGEPALICDSGDEWVDLCVGRPRDWTADCAAVPEVCATCYPADCSHIAIPDVDVSPAFESCWCEPLAAIRWACLADGLLDWHAASFEVRLSNFEGDSRNLSVSIYEARDGDANPATDLGWAQLANRTPIARSNIVAVPEGGTITMDSARRSALVECGDGSPRRTAPDFVQSATGGLWEPLTAERVPRVWVVVDADWYNVACDLRIEVFVAPREGMAA